jgi:hypothetical protein
LTGRLSRVFCCVDFQRVFLGILESASFRGVKSGMLRENGKGNPTRGVSKLTLKVKSKLEKRNPMEIAKSIYDLASVLVFFGIAMAPRAIGTYLALRKGEQ